MDETPSSQQSSTTRAKQARWQAVTELFDRCAGLTTEEREQILQSADGATADEVRSLLEHSDPETGSLLSPMEQILNSAQSLPQQIGAYRVERMLGQGGMGSVFLARRVGEFDQLVAVKLIRRDFGAAAESLERRFRQERQILANLQHPFIAHLIDGGTSDLHPYLVVEYVPGLRIDDYCNRKRLSIRQRIELFLKVCSAVQHAHQALIVHRDLKPANVLVLDDGTPKLLDFGIAKLMGEGEHDSDLTRTALRAFTPSYASPEQLRGEAVGTASDVYSLGVMLYELLTGQKPHQVDTDSEFAVADAILRQTPPLASAAIKRYSEEERERKAADRTTTYAAWTKALRDDLDLILSRAISADLKRRYQSVEQLSSDLNRYLVSLPISVRKDTWSYRASKFWSRHKPLMSVTSLALVLLLIAGFALWRETRIAIRQRERAERRFNDLRALARSNITEVQDALDRVPGGTAVRTLILTRALQYLDGLAAEKDNDIDIQRDLAGAYLMVARRLGNPASANLGDFAGANRHYDRSIRIRESIVALPQATEKDRFQLIYVRYHKAVMQNQSGQLEAARQTLAQAASSADAILASRPHDLTEALNFVGLTHRALSAHLCENGAAPSLGDPVQALRHSDIALQSAEKVYAQRPKDSRMIANLISTRGTHAMELFNAGREEEGTKLQRSTLELIKASRSVLTADANQIVAFTNYQYGMQLAKHDPRAALPVLDAVLAAIVGARNSDPANIKMAEWFGIGMTNIGNVHRRAGEREKGLKMMVEGMTELTNLLARTPTAGGELRYALATGHRGLGDSALDDGKRHQALSEYESAERVYAEDAARVPDDLEVYSKRAENQLSIAAVESTLGLTKQAAASRLLASEFANHILRVHPDHPIAQKLKQQASATKN